MNRDENTKLDILTVLVLCVFHHARIFCRRQRGRERERERDHQ